MRLLPGLQTPEATPVPSGGSDGDDGFLTTAFDAVWDQIVEALKWLGEFSGKLIWAGIIVFAIVWITGRLRRRLRATLEGRVRGHNNLPALVDNVLQILIYIFAAVVALSALGADSTALVSTFGLITAAISLSLQDVLKNFVAGLYLLAEQPFRSGDRLEVSGQVGTVEEVNVRTTVLRNDKAEQVLVPNYQVFSQVVSNRSAYRLRALTVQVTGIKGDPDEALAGAEGLLADLPGATQNPPKVELVKISPDGCDLTVTVWADPGQDPRRESVQRLRARFPEATVTIAA